jgi:hypothetical protein
VDNSEVAAEALAAQPAMASVAASLAIRKMTSRRREPAAR